MSIRRIVLAVVAPLVFLGAAEGLLRLGGFGYETDYFLERDGVVKSNPRYGWQYFPRAIARAPEPVAFSARKKPGGRRTFVLGESAAMGFPDPRFGLARYLAAGGGEVINAAMTAIGSHAIVDIARACARYDPDEFVVYMGNNEAIGPPALTLKKLRLGQLLSPTGAGTEWRGMEMFLDRRMPFGDPRLESIYEDFRENLSQVIRIGRAAGAAVTVSTIAVNLRDCPPFAGDDAMAAWKAGNFARARDLDELRFRADSRINFLIREVASAEGARLVDAEKLLAPDATLFWEHVHLTPEGNRALAKAIAGSAAEIEFTSWDRARMARTMHALTARAPFATSFPRKFHAPPVSFPEAVAAYRRAAATAPEDLIVRERFAELLHESGDWAGAVHEWRFLLAQIPAMPGWHTGLAESLLVQGKQAEARGEYEAALAIDGEFVAGHIGLGTVLFQQGKTAEAESRFRRAVAMRPGSPQAHHNLGMALGAMGRLDEAVAALETAVRLDPSLAKAHYNLAGSLARKGMSDRAEVHYRAAIAAEPDFADAHYDLGAILARNGKIEEAMGHYREAVRVNPRHADAHNNWGTALAKLGRLKEATERFDEALRIDPGHAQARRNRELAARKSR